MIHILGITWGVMPGAIDLISKKHNKSEVPQFFSFFSRVCSGEALQETWEFLCRGTFAKEVAHFHEANIPKLHTWLIQGKWMKKKRKRRSAFWCVFFFLVTGWPGWGFEHMQRRRQPEFLQVVDFDALDIFGVDEAGMRWGKMGRWVPVGSDPLKDQYPVKMLGNLLKMNM